jgi:tetratricopeptide (TPR) repeat protein
LAFALHVLGKVEKAEALAAELHAMPQRVGMVSSAADVETLIRTFHYQAMLRARQALEREQRSYAPWWRLPALAPLELHIKGWQLDRTLLQLLTRGTALVESVRPNLVTNPHEWPGFLVGNLIDTLGTGVIRKTLEEARGADAAFPEATPYFDAFEGEVAYRDGLYEEAIDLAMRALASLDKHEALLRWRTLAWQADAMTHEGRVSAAAAAYQEVLEKFPSVLRMLEIAIPATVSHDGSTQAEKVASRLEGSRRFDVKQEAPFALAVSTRGDKLEICLRNQNGMQISCSLGDSADAVLSTFHADCFSPRVALGQLDLNSLDGSTGSSSADDALKSVLP